ncbi:MAG: hypothetical protein LBC41_08725 [Clostridiales bacterium]|jgi:hypothetical protein|nr:hypothetical protein [Clostridiales bacterium]
MGKVKIVFSTALVALLITITGTYAWIRFYSFATSKFTGSDEAPGGTTHDDFNDPNKDVYVENWGNIPIFVRVKLSEYMEVGKLAGTASEEKDVETLVESTKMEDESTWQPHVLRKESDEPDLFREYWHWEFGGQKHYMPVSKENQRDGYIDQNSAAYDGSEPGVKQTRHAEVIDMEAWINLGRPVGDYWVGDSDGWFYWAAPLVPGEATGLLLNKVEKVKNIVGAFGGSYYYGIIAVTQMATAYAQGASLDDYRTFGATDKGGWTQEGETLMKTITCDTGVTVRQLSKGAVGNKARISPSPFKETAKNMLLWELTKEYGDKATLQFQTVVFDNGKTINEKYVSNAYYEIAIRLADPYFNADEYGIVEAGDNLGHEERPGMHWWRIGMSGRDYEEGFVEYYKICHRESGNYAMVHMIVVGVE